MRGEREVGVRAALGARPTDIVGLVVGDGLRVTIVGVGVGVLLALASIRSWHFGANDRARVNRDSQRGPSSSLNHAPA